MTQTATPSRPLAPAPAWLPWAALLVVYVVWGSTYLAIAIGIETVPPLLLAGTRYLVAGGLMYAFVARRRRSARPAGPSGARPWAAAAVVGVMTLSIGNGGVSVAEQSVPSGVAALLVATVPLWMILADRVLNGRRVGLVRGLALLVGLAGVAVLVHPGGDGTGSTSGLVILLVGSASWGFGSVVSGRLTLPADHLRSAAMQMLTGGAALLVAATVSGELGDLDPGRVTLRSLLALAYLVGPGSLLALTAYVVALRTLPTTTVATYAYVNPVVAVTLGALVLSEPVTAHLLVGAAVVTLGVAVSLLARPRPT
ncbi:EamA family transporter [Nocardioides lijunqiniae]|uniref:EamA family transporter n=1 Tax=Nocardioides lijunqiniae TaxID=2760832 RepID=UPI00187787BE|nr:EamA family transporter [Nocardioides lijunqiniae]